MKFYFRSALHLAGLVFFFLAALLPCAHGKEVAFLSRDTVPTITSHELQALETGKKAFLLVDVRQPEEYNQGHIKDAVLIPLQSLPSNVNKLPKNEEIIVYCRSGRRSAQAVSFLRAQGYANAFSLSGGYVDWVNVEQLEAKKPGKCPSSTKC